MNQTETENELEFLRLLEAVPADDRDVVLEELRLIAECGDCHLRHGCSMYNDNSPTVDTMRPER